MKNYYPYSASPTGRYKLSHDGRELMQGTEEEVWRFLHRHQGQSVDYALNHGGYKVEALP